jgi:hypothetical protein
MRRVAGLSILFVLIVMALMTACGGSKKTVPPAIAVSLTPSARVALDEGQTKNLSATVTNDAKNGGVSWSLSGAGTLSSQTTTSVTYNAPTSGGTTSATVTATSVTDSTKTATVSIAISAAPSIATTPAPTAGTNGTAYSFTVPQSGGTAPLTWLISAGTLPTGLTLSAGKISGMPNANATQSPFSFTVQVQDGAGMSATQAYSMTVANPPAPVINSTSPPAGTNGTAYTAFTFAVSSGGMAPFTWSENGALPTGLTLSAAGVLSGTPQQSGSFPITVTVQDGSNPKQMASQGFTIQINNPGPPTITTTSLPDGAVGTAYSQTIQATGGLTPFAWLVSSGTLPAGLTLGSSTTRAVTLSGTPTTVQSNVQFTVQVSDGASQTATQNYTVNIAAQPIVVTISNKISTIQAGGAPVTLNAVVQGDTQGVTWTLIANGSDCQPACGTLSNATTASVTYTPPAMVPGAPGNAPTIVATSVTDNTKSDADSFTITSVSASCTAQGNEAELNGQYAFSLSGFNSTGYLAVVGSFAADGTGKITGGEIDSNGALGVKSDIVVASASSYSVGSDGRGCAVIATSFGVFTARIAVGAVTSGVALKGRIIEWETGSGAFIATGQLIKQDVSSFTAAMTGNYVFGVTGWNTSNSGAMGVVGVMTFNGGQITTIEQDYEDGQGAGHTAAGTLTGTYSSLDANGRGTTTITGGNQGSTGAVYRVSASKFFYIQTSSDPVVVGELKQQSGTFNNGSLNGKAVMYGEHLQSTGSNVLIGIASAGGNGALTAAMYKDVAGTLSPVQNAVCTYSVASNGRTVLGGDCANTVFYLAGVNTGVALSTDAGESLAQFEAQSGSGSFTNSSVNGTYFAGSVRVVSQSQDTGLNSVTLLNGSVSGTGDYTSTSYQQGGDSFTDSYSIGSNGAFSTSQYPSDVTGIAISNNKFVMIDNVNSQYPSVTVAER